MSACSHSAIKQLKKRRLWPPSAPLPPANRPHERDDAARLLQLHNTHCALSGALLQQPPPRTLARELESSIRASRLAAAAVAMAFLCLARSYCSAARLLGSRAGAKRLAPIELKS